MGEIPDFRPRQQQDIGAIARLMQQKAVAENNAANQKTQQQRQFFNDILDAVEQGQQIVSRGIAISQANKKQRALTGLADTFREPTLDSQVSTRPQAPPRGTAGPSQEIPVTFGETQKGQTQLGRRQALATEAGIGAAELGKSLFQDTTSIKSAAADTARKIRAGEIKDSKDLRGEFQKLSKDFIVIGNSFQRIRDSVSDPSQAGDIAMIFNFMKMLDPNSVVRESEFATVENAGNVPQRVRSAYNRLLTTDGRLSGAQRKDFFNRSVSLFEGQAKKHGTVVSEYTRLANTINVDPSLVITSFGTPSRKELQKIRADFAKESKKQKAPPRPLRTERHIKGASVADLEKRRDALLKGRGN